MSVARVSLLAAVALATVGVVMAGAGAAPGMTCFVSIGGMLHPFPPSPPLPLRYVALSA